MYIPRLRRMSDAIDELRKTDPVSALTPHFLETLIYSQQLTQLKYGYAWLLNLDELYAYLTADGVNKSVIEPLTEKMMTSTEILRLFRTQDENTLIRRPNLRRFVETNGISFFRFNRSKWIINVEEFMQAINPRGIHQKAEPPKIRSLCGAFQSLKQCHPHLKITMDIVMKAFHSEQVFKIKNGGHWLLNYEELEHAVLSEIYIIKK